MEHRVKKFIWSKLSIAALVALLFSFVLCSTSGSALADPVSSVGPDATGIFGEDASSPVDPLGAFVHAFAFDLPRARGNVDQRLGLIYSSSATDLEAGYGWGLDIPWIQRAPLTGWPDYNDGTDRFSYAGRVLSFVCVAGEGN